MKTAVAWLTALALIAFAVAAQARLTPYQGTQNDAGAATQQAAENFGPSSARLEDHGFQRPLPPDHVIDRCTVPILVFSKIRLARACY
jgi:hypothetical protein